MPIPAFDSILNILPPHLGDPRFEVFHSPYRCTVTEVCQRFNFSPERLEILKGFLGLRKELFALGLRGFQWLDGSFIEDIETQEGRAPHDVDVVTFVHTPADRNALDVLLRGNGWLLDSSHTKANYFSDHFIVPLLGDARQLVSLTRFWYGLFSHRRDSLWKGMLQVELEDPNDDSAATLLLGGGP